MSTYAPFAKPLYVMLKPVGALCNLAYRKLYSYLFCMQEH